MALILKTLKEENDEVRELLQCEERGINAHVLASEFSAY
jgi:hypothetical protein